MASSPTDSADKVFPPFDPTTVPSQLLWLVLTFGIFYILMSRFALPRIGSILEMRSDRIAQDFDEAERLAQESESAREAYESELADARSKAQGIAQEARQTAKAELDAKRELVEADLSKKMEEAEKRISDLKTRGMGEVDKIASDISDSIIETVLATKGRS